jgi:hypothetical protein
VQSYAGLNRADSKRKLQWCIWLGLTVPNDSSSQVSQVERCSHKALQPIYGTNRIGTCPEFQDMPILRFSSGNFGCLLYARYNLSHLVFSEARRIMVDVQNADFDSRLNRLQGQLRLFQIISILAAIAVGLCFASLRLRSPPSSSRCAA